MVEKSKWLTQRANELRAKPTRYEQIFCDKLDAAGIDYYFQTVIGDYIVDFLIRKVIIEIDGAVHNGREIYDSQRTVYLKRQGYKVIRLLNNEIQALNVKKFVFENIPLDKPKRKQKKLKDIKSTSPKFKKLSWNKQRVILQKERLDKQ